MGLITNEETRGVWSMLGMGCRGVLLGLSWGVVWWVWVEFLLWWVGFVGV